ncbi:MAG: O-acetyl-ADP-ribose deacetylase [Deltaproteobacteria bacterium]|nr:O-acetyl-ADP-ribose deacetylase [Deltaproteobacteria bacterium]
MEKTFGNTRVTLVHGDLTRQDVDAVVNAANSSLLGGGGVDGAIHRAGGPAILEECKAIVARQGSLPPGRAVVTTGGRLPARRVIHTVGPVWHGGARGEAGVLRSAYQESLGLAEAEGLRSVAFPSISTGAYGYPVAEAARVALEAVAERLRAGSPLAEVRFVLHTAADRAVYEEALEKLPA